MSLTYPDDLKYMDTHEYVRLEGDVATIGISAFAVDELGDIVFVEVPAEEAAIAQGEVFGTIESVKAVADLYAPVTGTVIESNQSVMDDPEQLAADPYGAGWLVRVKVSNPAELNTALTADQYRQKVEGSK